MRRIESSKCGSEKSCNNKESSSSTSKNKTPSLSGAQKPPSGSGWRRFLKLWKRSSIKRLPPLVAPKKVSRRFSRSARESCDFDRCPLNSNWRTFTLAQLEAATNNFSQG